MPPPDVPPTTWGLFFSTDTLDERIEMRGVLARLREDPNVEEVERTLTQDGPSTRGERYTVRFRDGFDGPQARDLQSIGDRYADWRRGTQYELPTRVTPEPRPNQNGDFIPPEVRSQLISQYLASSEGRSRLAASMVAPLRARMDYQSIGRRTFLVEQLPDGALPTYDRDPEVARTLFPEFEMASNPTISIAEVRSRRFDIIDRNPPFEPPAWLRVPMWVYCEAQDWHAEVVDCAEGRITLRNWRRLPEIQVIDGREFTNLFQPCDQPKEPRERFDRMLDDDFLAELAPAESTKITVSVLGKKIAEWLTSKIKQVSSEKLGKNRFDHDPLG